MAQFSNKVALVVGGTLGIGQATALLLAQQGAQVVVAGRDPDHGRQTVEYIEGCGGRAVYHPVDLLKPATIEALIRYTVETFGQLDYLVQSAGLEGSVAPTVDCTEDNWYSVINTNITGMRYNYRCLFARKTFTINPGEVPSSLRVRYCKDDGIVIWARSSISASSPSASRAR